MFYYVLEFQTGNTGAAIPFVYSSQSDAEEKYHDILKYASKSSVHKHGAVLLDENMTIIKQELYEH